MLRQLARPLLRERAGTQANALKHNPRPFKTYRNSVAAISSRKITTSGLLFSAIEVMAIGDWAISAVKNRPPKTAAILHSVRSSRVFVHLARIINPPPAFIPPYTQSQFTFFHPGVDPVYEIKLRPGLHSYEIAGD